VDYFWETHKETARDAWCFLSAVTPPRATKQSEMIGNKHLLLD
jgi:hypothetical protein